MRIGFCTGCFDLFHRGHLYFLTEARKHCDYLIVAVNTDASVLELKGDPRPYDELQTRIENVMETGLVDAALPFTGDDVTLALQINPGVIIRSREYMPDRGPETGFFCLSDERFADIVWVDRIPGLSTTEVAKCRA